MDRSFRKLTNLAANSSDNTDLPPLPAGKLLTVTKFGAADINTGDHKSSAYLLQWGTAGSFVELGVIAVTGNTVELDMKEQLKGIESGHIVPLDRGGRHNVGNSFLILTTSNRMQGNLTFDELIALMEQIIAKQRDSGRQ